MDKSPKKDAVTKELTRIAMAKPAIRALLKASEKGPENHRRQLRALAGRIQLCNDPSNTLVIKDAYSDFDRPPTDGLERAWRCNSKLCPSCLARQALLTRRKLREAISHQKLKRNERYTFATFTIPNPSLPLLETRSIVQYAWSLFRKRSLCVSLIRGGVKSEEFTTTPNGFHYHLHLLMISKWFLFDELRRTWTDCVIASFKEHERPFTIPTRDGMLYCVFKEVLPTERTIHELCKYVTKCDSWTKIRKRDLVEIALIRRWNRMFELFGSFAKRELPVPRSVPPIVHTKSLTDGSASPRSDYWRNVVEQIDPEIYLIQLEDRMEHFRNAKFKDLRIRFPDKTITTLQHEIYDRDSNSTETWTW
jgi:hypothetical protein